MADDPGEDLGHWDSPAHVSRRRREAFKRLVPAAVMLIVFWALAPGAYHARDVLALLGAAGIAAFLAVNFSTDAWYFSEEASGWELSAHAPPAARALRKAAQGLLLVSLLGLLLMMAPGLLRTGLTIVGIR